MPGISLRSALPCVVVLAWLCSAESFADESNWHLQVEALTDVPIDVGARVVVEGPLRLRLSTSLGVLPGPYVDLINDAVVGFGGYNQQTAALIAASLSSSLVWRTHLGWRPFPKAGFVFDVGYGLVALGGGVKPSTAIASVAGITLSRPSGSTYDVSSMLHMIDADVGWEFTFFSDHLVLETSLGFAGTLAASTTAVPEGSSTRSQDAFGNQAAAYLNHLYTSYVFTPVATVALGYRFF